VANVGRVETWVVLAGLIDLDVERKRIRAALEETERLMKGLQGRLSNQDFLKKAPPEVVAKERERAAEFENRKKRLEENLQTLGE
jgi:valyl-tRNA synthetase